MVVGRAAANGRRVLESLYRRPIVSLKQVGEMTRTTTPAAKDLARRFVDRRILVEIAGFARNRRHRYDDYVPLFTEGTEADQAG